MFIFETSHLEGVGINDVTLIFFVEEENGAEDEWPSTLTGFGFLTCLALRSFNFSIFSQFGLFLCCISDAVVTYVARAGRGNRVVSVFCSGGFRGTEALLLGSSSISDMPFPFLFLTHTCELCRFWRECWTQPRVCLHWFMSLVEPLQALQNYQYWLEGDLG